MQRERYSFALEWISVDRPSGARKRALEGATLPISWLTLRKGALVIVARAPESEIGAISAAAAWAMAIGDGVIVSQIGDDRYWMALAAEGLPVPGFDVAGDETSVRDKLADAIAMGIDTSRIYGLLPWDEIPPAEHNRKGFEDIVATLPLKTLESCKLRKMPAGGSGYRKAMFSLMALAVLAGGGAYWWHLRKVQALEHAQLLQRLAAARRMVHPAESDAEKARQQALAKQRSEMLATWSGSLALSRIVPVVSQAAALPRSFAGMTPAALNWSPGTWSLTWAAANGNQIDVMALNALAQANSATQSCNLWQASCTWHGASPIARAFSAEQRLASLEEADAWLAQMARARAVDLQPQAPKAWPLLHLATRSYVLKGTGMPAFFQAYALLERVPGVRVAQLRWSLDESAWTMGVVIWGALA